MGAYDDKAKVEAARAALSRLASGDSLTRAGLFEGTEVTVEWQRSFLKKLIKKDMLNLMGSYKWARYIASDPSLFKKYLDSNIELSKLVFSIPTIEDVEEDESGYRTDSGIQMETPVSDKPPALVTVKKNPGPLLSLNETIELKVNEQVTERLSAITAQLAEARKLAPGSSNEVQEAILKLVAATTENVIYIREQQTRMAEQQAEMLTILRKLL